MNGDLSLSRALGGLRIANPDDATPDASRDIPTEAGDLQPPAVEQHGSTSSPGQYSQHQADESASTILRNAQNNLGHAQRQLDAGAVSDPYLQPQYHTSAYQPTSSSSNIPAPSSGAARPVSGVYRNSMPLEPDHRLATTQSGHLRADTSSHSPAYDGPVRNNSRSSPSSRTAPIPSRESSRSYNGPRQGAAPPGNGPLPPRRSSKGMGGGYASVSGMPQAAPAQGSTYAPDGALPTSSEEWKDRGAAVGVRKEVDAEGRTVLRSVKKGVRDFSFSRTLGEGSYSTVYLGTDRQTLREYAIKVLEKKHIIKEKKIKYVNIEKNTLNRLTEHPGIVRLYYTFQDETSLYYVLDLCSGGELLGVLKKTGTFDVECTRFYGAQILDAIEYMHSRGVIHRDLKPENVLLDDQMHIKITDFGTAKLLRDPRDPRPPDNADNMQNQDDQRTASFVGTAEYVSPELLTNKSVGKPSDLWAFGCIIYQLIAGRPPFKGGSEYLTFQKIVNLEFEFPEGFPPAARDLVERCLVLDPARRLTVEHIKNHEFFDGQKFGKELWRTKAPRLRPYIPPAQEPRVIQLNGSSSAASAPTPISRGIQQSQSNGSRPARIVTELLPPTQLDIEWSPVLTRNNERILKLGDQMVISSPIPNHHGKSEHGDGHKKFSRFFGGSTTKKRQRLVMITSSGRIVLAPAGGEEKKAKQEISLLTPDCTWRSQIDAKGQVVWCVDSNGVHYTFEQPKSSAADAGTYSADDWIESLERAKDLAISQNLVGSYSSDNGFGDMSSSMSSPASTLGGRSNFPEGFSVGDRSGRNQLTKSQASLDETKVKRNRFSKQSKNGLGAAF